MDAGRNANWNVKYAGHPIPHIVWRNKYGLDIPWFDQMFPNKSLKYHAVINGEMTKTTTLTIKNVSLSDAGKYNLFADNGQMSTSKDFELLVKGNLYKK